MVDIGLTRGKFTSNGVFFVTGCPGINLRFGAVRFLLVKDAFCPFHFLACEIRLIEQNPYFLILYPH